MIFGRLSGCNLECFGMVLSGSARARMPCTAVLHHPSAPIHVQSRLCTVVFYIRPCLTPENPSCSRVRCAHRFAPPCIVLGIHAAFGGPPQALAPPGWIEWSVANPAQLFVYRRRFVHFAQVNLGGPRKKAKVVPNYLRETNRYHQHGTVIC